MINWTKAAEASRYYGYLGSVDLKVDPDFIIQKCGDRCWTVEIDGSGNADAVFPTLRRAKEWSAEQS